MTAMSREAYVPLSLLSGSQFHNYNYSFLLGKLLYMEIAKPNEAKEPPSLLSSAQSHNCQVLQLFNGPSSRHPSNPYGKQLLLHTKEYITTSLCPPIIIVYLNDELERVSIKAVMVYFKILFLNYLEGTQKNHETVSR
jgi:hypothetical protein